jgi:2-phosphosulfolactate phosphatase
VAEVHVFLSPSEVTPAEISGKVVAVIDVLRASTSIAVALANGAKTVVPLGSVDEAMTRAKQMERGDVRLAGERKLERVEGFDIGNSPMGKPCS